MDPEQNSQTAKAPKTRRAGRVHRWALRLLGAVLAGVLALGVGVILWLSQRDVPAPNWLRQRIETAINAQVQGQNLQFGQIFVHLDQGFALQLRLQDLGVAAPDGHPLFAVADLTASLDLASLVQAKVHLQALELNGAAVRVRRLADGGFDLSLGTEGAMLRQSATLAQLIQSMDAFLTRPALLGLARVDAQGLSLQFEDLRVGRTWRVDGARLRLDRVGDQLTLSGDMAVLGEGAGVALLAAQYRGRIGQVASDFGVNFEEFRARDLAVQSPALAWLDALRAPISGAMRGSVAQDGALGPLSATLSIGAGALQPTDAARPVPFTAARAYLTVSPAQQTIRFDELMFDSKWISMRADGVAQMHGLENGLPQAFTGQFTLSEFRANPADVFPAPISFEAADADLHLQLSPFNLRIGRMTVQDQGQVLQLSGHVSADSRGWAFGVGAQMPQIARARVLQLWPERAAPRTRAWVAENVHQAQLKDIEFALRKSPDSPAAPYLAFGFEQAALSVIRDFPRLQRVSGTLQLLNDRLLISADQGRVRAAGAGWIDIAGTTFEVPNTRQPVPQARVGLATAGPLGDALHLLDAPPFQFLQKAGLSPDLASGQLRLGGTIDLPLQKNLPAEDIVLSLQGVARDMRSDVLVPGLVVQAPQLQIDLQDRQLAISGPGQVGAVPVTATWRSPIGPGASGSTLSGQITLGQAFVDTFGIGLPPGAISGAAQADMTLQFKRAEPPTFLLASQLQGLGLSLPQVGWALRPEQTGALEVQGQLGTPVRIDRLSLQAAGLLAQGALQLTPEGQLDRASFSQFAVGDWLEGALVLSGRGPGLPPAIALSDGRIDMRRANFAGSDGQSGPLTLSLDRLQLTKDITFNAFEGAFEAGKGLDGQFTARVNGATAVQGRVVPRDGRVAVRIRSRNAGGVLLSAGLLQSAREGALDLTLLPTAAPGSFQGTLRITDIWLREAPIFSALLNAVSVVGLIEQLRGTGVLFSEVDGRFRLSPDQIIVDDFSATGASVGISMQGSYGVNSRQMDLSGVFSPVYVLNGLGSVLTRKGEGLLGFNYTLTGEPGQPRVQVNPLSIFTPGMFRDIFRRPAPEPNQ